MARSWERCLPTPPSRERCYGRAISGPPARSWVPWWGASSGWSVREWSCGPPRRKTRDNRERLTEPRRHFTRGRQFHDAETADLRMGPHFLDRVLRRLAVEGE